VRLGEVKQEAVQPLLLHRATLQPKAG